MIIHIKAQKNTAFILVTPIYDGEWSSSYVSTASNLDSESSTDKGNFADLTNELTEIQATGVYSLDITAAEMNFDLVVVKMTSTTVGANIPLHVIHTYSEQLDIANTELASVPNTTSNLREMIQLVFEYLRNRKTVTANTETVYKEDAASALGTASITDDGTTFDKGELG